MEPFIGQIILFAGNFAPRGFALCQGQLLSISQNSALFSLLGTTYGGDGTSSFGLPDLRGRVVMQQGTGPGLSNRTLGQKFGTETESLQVNQLPAHNHVIVVSAPTDDPKDANTAGVMMGKPGGAPANKAVQFTGDGDGHNNVQPSMPLNYCIAMTGTFPSRS